jgi:hypothetical protein
MVPKNNMATTEPGEQTRRALHPSGGIRLAM